MYTLEMCETREDVCVLYQHSALWSWLQPPLFLFFTCGWSWDLDSVSWKLVLFQVLPLGSALVRIQLIVQIKISMDSLNFYFISSSQTLFIASFSSFSFLSRVHEPVQFSLCPRAPFQALYQHPSRTSPRPMACLPTPSSHLENCSPYCNKDQFLKVKISLCDFPS